MTGGTPLIASEPPEVSVDENVPETKPRSLPMLALWLVTVGLATAADLASKHLAIEHLSRGRFSPIEHVCRPEASGYVPSVRISGAPKVVLEGFFEFRYAENCGAAFGFLNDVGGWGRAALFYTAAVVAVLAMGHWFRSGKGGRWFVLASITITAGALGNLADRIRLGYVVDFVRFYGTGWPVLGDWEYPTFNVADVWIFLGVVGLLVDEFKEWKAQRAAQKSPAPVEVVVPDLPADGVASTEATSSSGDAAPPESEAGTGSDGTASEGASDPTEAPVPGESTPAGA